VTIAIDEQHIAQLLMSLARAEIKYTNIAVATPTLEDYFVSIARSGRPS
jgi:hypothetical protein